MADNVISNVLDAVSSLEEGGRIKISSSYGQKIEFDDDPSRQGPLLRKKKTGKEKLDQNPRVEEPCFTSKTWSICRVPAHLREVDEKAYDPKIVSIGPVHHNKPCLKAMETQKMRFLNRLFEHTVLRMVDLEEAMLDIEGKTRECYSENFDYMDSNDFVQMMVVDSCFIVELLRLYEMSNKGMDVEELVGSLIQNWAYM